MAVLGILAVTPGAGCYSGCAYYYSSESLLKCHDFNVFDLKPNFDYTSGINPWKNVNITLIYKAIADIETEESRFLRCLV